MLQLWSTGPGRELVFRIYRYGGLPRTLIIGISFTFVPTARYRPTLVSFGEMFTNILSLVCDGDIHLPQHPAKDHVHDFQALSPCSSDGGAADQEQEMDGR